MERLTRSNVVNSGVLGTQVTFELVYENAPTSVAISIYSPTLQELVNDVAMSVGDSTKYYTYEYQSSTVYPEGLYSVQVEATFGSNIVTDVINFKLKNFNLE